MGEEIRRNRPAGPAGTARERVGIPEKNITLAISQALFNRLQSMPGLKPVMIREGDYYVELKRRPEIARRSRAGRRA